MKLLLVSSGYPPRGHWGTEQYTRELACGLLARGHRVDVLVPASGAGEPYALSSASIEGITLHTLGLPARRGRALRASYLDPRVERAFELLLRRLRPDHVHFLQLLWGLSVRLPSLCRAEGIGATLTLTDLGLLCHRGQMFDWRLQACGGPHDAAHCARCIRTPSRHEGGRVVAALRRGAGAGLALAGGLELVPTAADVRARETEVARALAAADCVVAPTRGLERLFLQAGVPRAKLVHLTYAFDPAPFEAARREPADATVTLGYVGQYAPHKGPHVLLEAVRRLEASGAAGERPWRVVLHGRGGAHRHRDYPRALERLARHPRVELRDPFEARGLPRVLAGLHALVVPSLWLENAPFAALQARAAGVPVLASDVEGIREVIESGRHGLLFPPGDADGLARCMGEVVRGRLRRAAEPEPALDFREHLERLEELYALHLRAPLVAGGVAP